MGQSGGTNTKLKQGGKTGTDRSEVIHKDGLQEFTVNGLEMSSSGLRPLRETAHTCVWIPTRLT